LRPTTPNSSQLNGSGRHHIRPGFGQLSSLSVNSIGRRRFQRLYSTKVILLCATLTMFVVVAALVVVAGYTVTCNELHYETKRQLYGRTTLGTPIKNLNIACYSLFRDVDFHSRNEIHQFVA
jgi:hypothetical protein